MPWIALTIGALIIALTVWSDMPPLFKVGVFFGVAMFVLAISGGG